MGTASVLDLSPARWWPVDWPLAAQVLLALACAECGFYWAHRLAHDLALRQLVVVSGLARGIDSAAHRGALEAKGKTWKVYAQAYPGNCFLGAQSGNYVRKHVPFLSYVDVQQDARRCAGIVDDSGFSGDIANGRLPDFSLFIPDIKNDGHDTGVAYADNWLNSYFTPLLKDPAFMKDMLLVISFDEDDKSTTTNHIYTALYGDSVIPGSVSDGSYTHYSLLRTIEDTFGLGTLNQNDRSAAPITGVWR